MTRALGWLALFLAACTGEPSGSVRAAIVGGAATIDYPAVGALVMRRARCEEHPLEALCTVTAIAPDVVITAAHCVTDYRERQLEVSFGRGIDDPDAQYRVVVQHLLHPDYDETSSDFDLALLLLSAPIDAAPVALQDATINGWVGETMIVVGFGEAEDTSGQKREGTAVISRVDPRTFEIAPSPAMTCHGDSGGPALAATDGRLVGITAAGDIDCAAWGRDVRVDAHRGFIDATLLAIERPSPSVLAPTALCSTGCMGDSECPTSLICLSGACVLPQSEPARFEGSCSADAECGAGPCAPVDDGCACSTPCAAPSGGCRIARAPSSGAPFFLLLFYVLVTRARRRASGCRARRGSSGS